tara:strand:+ start:222 stop:494 length:273 start_codon:yes stop_codon:yes gene_type:complete
LWRGWRVPFRLGDNLPGHITNGSIMYIGSTPTVYANGKPPKPPEEEDKKVRGLGDLVARGLEKIGIRKKPGCGCHKRQKALNKMVPFSRR